MHPIQLPALYYSVGRKPLFGGLGLPPAVMESGLSEGEELPLEHMLGVLREKTVGEYPSCNMEMGRTLASLRYWAGKNNT